MFFTERTMNERIKKNERVHLYFEDTRLNKFHTVVSIFLSLWLTLILKSYHKGRNVQVILNAKMTMSDSHRYLRHLYLINTGEDIVVSPSLKVFNSDNYHMFSCSRNVQVTFLYRNLNRKRFVYKIIKILIHTWLVKTFKSTIVAGNYAYSPFKSFYFTVLWVQLYNCTTVQLYNCTTVQLYNCTTVQLETCLFCFWFSNQ